MAEREGFEPSVQLSPDAVLAGLWFKPLTHLSKTLADTSDATTNVTYCFTHNFCNSFVARAG